MPSEGLCVFFLFLFLSFPLRVVQYLFRSFFSFWIFFYENQDTRLIHSARSRKGRIWFFFFSIWTVPRSTCLSSSVWSTACIQHHLIAFVCAPFAWFDFVESHLSLDVFLVSNIFFLFHANTYDLLIICWLGVYLYDAQLSDVIVYPAIECTDYADNKTHSNSKFIAKLFKFKEFQCNYLDGCKKKELLTKCTENPNQNGNEYKISNTKMVNIIKDSDTLRDKPNKTIKMLLLFDGKFEKNYVEMYTMRPNIRYETKQPKSEWMK